MALADAVGRVFDLDGALARSVQDYSPRAGQVAMAQAVATTLEDGGVLVVEAGTGVGKTYAYLVPALLSGARVLISTATKTLQDQLFSRDIPRLTAALGLPARVAMLKGRSSYLCAHRLSTARHDFRAMHPVAQADLAQIERWASTTRSGDIAEMAQLDERSPVIPLVTSTRENCLGTTCPQFTGCHINQARREAMVADVVVINHHLFFADLSIRESGVAELLPTVQCVVFDEAHQLNDIGVQFMGRQLSAAQLERYARDLGVQERHLARASDHWSMIADQLNRSVARFRALFSQDGSAIQQAWVQDQPSGVDEHQWRVAIADLHTALEQCQLVLRSVEELSPDLQGLSDRVSHLLLQLDVFSTPAEPGWVRWTETGRGIRLVQSPLDIAETLRAHIGGDVGNGARKSWIFTSATLGHDASLAQFIDSCGLEGAQVLHVHSPFDYASNAVLYLPTHLPKPSDARHAVAVAQLAAQGAGAIGGRTLVLTTTLRAMREIAGALRQHFSADGSMEVLLQGEAPKRELTDRFTQGQHGGNAGCILVASASFWEGVDVPGESLQLVVIDKLPFSPPDDPLVQARSRQLEAKGKNPFQHLHVPQAAIALKQGAGRLIRRITDRGILVVCDIRLTQMGYGRRILAALPAMRVVKTEGQFIQALDELTKPSTRDQPTLDHQP
ncbi:MAG: ATP-dependent DNA helicase [Burkholderiales bacterium]|nr:ATP-dependent DNA helicase [Burkholderiales bacterium]